MLVIPKTTPNSDEPIAVDETLSEEEDEEDDMKVSNDFLDLPPEDRELKRGNSLLVNYYQKMKS
jgi:hypothetical protein